MKIRNQNFLVIFLLLSFAEPRVSGAEIDLFLDFFSQPSKGNYFFFSTPFFISDDIGISLNNLIIIYTPQKKEIKINLGETAISEVKREKDYLLFCSQKSKIVKVGLYSETKSFELDYPCVIPPIETGNKKILAIDMKGTLCTFEEEGAKNCIDLNEEKEKITFLYFSLPDIIALSEREILVPYENTVFSVSEDLKVKYPVIEFSNSSFITFLALKENKLAISTENSSHIYEIENQNPLKLKELAKIYEEEILGTDFDGQKLVITSKNGISILDTSRKKILRKKIQGIVEISAPKIFGDNIIFSVSFGKYMGKVLPLKNSIVIAEYKDGKLKFRKEIIINSFARRIKLEQNKLAFITDSGTLWVFKIREK
ncbi:hypothetical protein HRbin19_01574 [bacterium HR19]|nr:hypothetical protein HRbin19_01574 [bacterium HR19]